MRAVAVAIVASIALPFAGCGEEPAAPLLAQDVIVTRPMPGMTMSAGYLTLSNNSRETIRITAVSSPQYAAVEMHETIIENDIARMRPLDALVVAPGSAVALAPGGRHLMLMRPAGTVDTVRLNFYDGETLLLSVDTVPVGR